MKQLPALIAIIAFFLATSCSFVPVSNQYEKAATLKKGNFELIGGFTGNGIAGGGESAAINNNYGFKVGYGLTDKTDIKIRYERLEPTGKDMDFKGAHYISLIPKFTLIPETFSLLIPLSHYSYSHSFAADKKESDRLVSIAPQVLYTFTNAKKTTDLSLGAKTDILFSREGAGALLGLSIGGGFSSNLDKWAVRPEISASFLGGSAFISYGVGMQFLLPKKTKLKI